MSGLPRSAAVGVGFYGNSETGDGVYQLIYSLDNANHTLSGIDTLVGFTGGRLGRAQPRGQRGQGRDAGQSLGSSAPRGGATPRNPARGPLGSGFRAPRVQLGARGGGEGLCQAGGDVGLLGTGGVALRARGLGGRGGEGGESGFSRVQASAPQRIVTFARSAGTFSWLPHGSPGTPTREPRSRLAPHRGGGPSKWPVVSGSLDPKTQPRLEHLDVALAPPGRGFDLISLPSPLSSSKALIPQPLRRASP